VENTHKLFFLWLNSFAVFFTLKIAIKAAAQKQKPGNSIHHCYKICNFNLHIPLVVLWHGMGDDCCNPDSMGRVMELIKSRLPGTFVYSVQVGSTVDEDQKSGFFGKIDEQVDAVCEQLAGIAELQHGFNAIGFSQVIQKTLL
jgi:hypothetical protein